MAQTPDTAASPASPEAATPDSGRIVMTKIFVTGLKVDAHIGVYAHEKGRAQPLLIDAELDVARAVKKMLERFPPASAKS